MTLMEHNNSKTSNQEALFSLAISGADKPKCNCPLGMALRRYLVDGPAHDAEFVKIIKERRPDWLHTPVEKIKLSLLAEAEKGEDRPPTTIGRGQTLNRYLNPASPQYDQEFANKIWSINPKWVYRLRRDYKQELIMLASSGGARPKQQSGPLGRYLTKVTSPSQTGAYDEEFTKDLREMRPDWFRPAKQSK
jgi:hypothetical protein